MKPRWLFIILLLITTALLLAACSESTETPTLVPTAEPVSDVEEPAAEEPPVEPVEAPTEEPAEEVSETGPETAAENRAVLQANPWQWVSFTDPVEQFEVENPESYFVQFNEDSTVSIVADCNNANGTYTADDNSLTMEIGPMTMAVCPEDSRSDQFVSLLTGAAIYFLEEGDLFIDLMADGGTMTLTALEEGPSAGVSEGANLSTLQSNSWQWVSFTDPLEQFDIDSPEAYLLTFNEDGTVNITADCNNASGSYTADESSLNIEIGPMTMAACPEDSRSDEFVGLLAGAANYFFEEDDLFIDLMADSGTVRFEPAAAAEQMPIDPESIALPEELVVQLDAYLRSQVYTEGGHPDMAAPGLVLYVETPDGRYLNAAGLADLDEGTAMEVDDILQIGSNTKSMVIVLLLQLAEEGVLSLDDLLSDWLPEQAAIVPNSDHITLRQMAMHTAGIHDYEDGIITSGLADPAELEKHYTPKDIVQFAMDEGGPDFSPGEAGMWSYSNTGYILLGMLIEEAAGESLNDLLQARVYDPLDLESAALIEDVPQEGEITTKGYKWTEVGERLDVTSWNGSQGWAAGSAAMTAEDLATYGKALAAGDFFQNPETLAEMLSFYRDALDSPFPYAMGLIDFAGDGTVWGHEGATPGFQSLWYTAPDDGIIVSGLTNSGAYSGFNFLNVLNILEGRGAQPFGPSGMLPGGQLFGTVWRWEQFNTSVEVNEIDPAFGMAIQILGDGSVTATSADCGQAAGSYTSSGIGNIDFEIDASTLTCDADSLAGQFVNHLNDASSWSFNNGSLLIELPTDSGTMILSLVSF